MVYLYAAFGVVMMTGIMAIFEMGLSLTGQSLLPSLPDEYTPSMKKRDKNLVVSMSSEEIEKEFTFTDSVSILGLCSALNELEPGSWTLIQDGYWDGSCQLSQGSHRTIVKKDTYQLFSCVLSNSETKCPFEIK